MKKICINGSRLYLRVDGMNRVLLEMVRSLDKIAEKDRYVLVIPHNVDKECYERIRDLKRIRVRRTALPYFRGWDLMFIDLLELLPQRITVNLFNRCPFFGGGINMIHDIIPIAFYGTSDGVYLRNVKRLLKRSDRVIVPSESTREDIRKAFGSKIQMEIINPGWQHYRDIREDENIFEEYPAIRRGEYYFSLSSISPHKNFGFIIEAAKRDSDRLFLLAGAMNRGLGSECVPPDNVMFLGRISEGRAKALMMNCRAFIFPSFCEGAGLPPLEALSCKVSVLAADIPSIHEYCGDSVRYFDPDDHDLDIESLLHTSVAPPEDALDKLSWDAAAQNLKRIIDSK